MKKKVFAGKFRPGDAVEKIVGAPRSGVVADGFAVSGYWEDRSYPGPNSKLGKEVVPVVWSNGALGWEFAKFLS